MSEADDEECCGSFDTEVLSVVYDLVMDEDEAVGTSSVLVVIRGVDGVVIGVEGKRMRVVDFVVRRWYHFVDVRKFILLVEGVVVPYRKGVGVLYRGLKL